MRGNLNSNNPVVNSETLSTHKRSRDDTTPNGQISSSVSAYNPSGQKKSVDTSSQKGSALSAAKVNKFITSNFAKPTKKNKSTKSTVTKIQ